MGQSQSDERWLADDRKMLVEIVFEDGNSLERAVPKLPTREEFLELMAEAAGVAWDHQWGGSDGL